VADDATKNPTATLAINHSSRPGKDTKKWPIEIVVLPIENGDFP
jgi:hypothetical protein